ncbi:hypothetical protein ANN_03149 [Periplaneta americana]|uniref:Uncharacterized protein n=1 Tax=Periplaneta americana TaxID=6978 RepID=A0ABQ8TY81_PERAM|nr:hypothetical protein ANN_03149 [Periplaneta americana]
MAGLCEGGNEPPGSLKASLQNPRRRIFCGPLEKELRKRLVKCFVWSVALYGEGTWTLRRNEEKRIEAFEMWMWRRTVRVKWTGRIRNKIVFEKVSEERMMLKLIRKRKRNWLGLWLKKIMDDIRICGSYAETKRKAENRKDWRLLSLQLKTCPWTEHLCVYVQNAWNIVSKNSRYLQRLVNSMPTRLQDDRDKRKID